VRPRADPIERWTRGTIRAAALIAVFLGGAAHAQDRSLEYPIKATFLARFAAYVDWPEDAFPSSRSPIGLCVVGEDPFGSLLDDAVRGQSANDRPMVVRRLQSLERDSPCHVVYFSASAEQDLREALDVIGDAPMLTVTDADVAPEAEAHGMIHFVVDDYRVRFHADEAAASQSRLALSSQLLGVALSVRRRAPP
jgi:hypothetical protein